MVGFTKICRCVTLATQPSSSPRGGHFLSSIMHKMLRSQLKAVEQAYCSQKTHALPRASFISSRAYRIHLLTGSPHRGDNTLIFGPRSAWQRSLLLRVASSSSTDAGPSPSVLSVLFNVPNSLGWLRLILLLVAMCAYALGEPQRALWFMMSSLVLDFADGLAARRLNQVTT